MYTQRRLALWEGRRENWPLMRVDQKTPTQAWELGIRHGNWDSVGGRVTHCRSREEETADQEDEGEGNEDDGKIRGNHLSNAACLTQVFFNNGE